MSRKRHQTTHSVPPLMERKQEIKRSVRKLWNHKLTVFCRRIEKPRFFDVIVIIKDLLYGETCSFHVTINA